MCLLERRAGPSSCPSCGPTRLASEGDFRLADRTIIKKNPASDLRPERSCASQSTDHSPQAPDPTAEPSTHSVQPLSTPTHLSACLLQVLLSACCGLAGMSVCCGLAVHLTLIVGADGIRKPQGEINKPGRLWMGEWCSGRGRERVEMDGVGWV